MANSVTEQATGQEKLQHNSHARVLRIPHLIVNSYLVGEPGTGAWAVVDAGLAARCADTIIRAGERRFGRGVQPTAIVLTHGHFDHVGGVQELIQRWKIPVYAHELELPYLTGRSAYPPPDPTVGGGLVARIAKFYPRRPIDLGAHVQPLPADGIVPGMPGWRWIHTPGHSPGHVSLFRFSDRFLIAGDAFVTVKQESLLANLTQRQQVSRPPAYFTADWAAARESIEQLLVLEPEVAATGHGIPMGGEELRRGLASLVENFERVAVPKRGRYVQQPALVDEWGVISVPPPAPDPVPKLITAAVASAGALTLLALLVRRRRGRTRPQG